jgi:hypothetical protein
MNRPSIKRHPGLMLAMLTILTFSLLQLAISGYHWAGLIMLAGCLWLIASALRYQRLAESCFILLCLCAIPGLSGPPAARAGSGLGLLFLLMARELLMLESALAGTQRWDGLLHVRRCRRLALLLTPAIGIAILVPFARLPVSTGVLVVLALFVSGVLATLVVMVNKYVL